MEINNKNKNNQEVFIKIIGDIMKKQINNNKQFKEYQ